MSESPEPLDPAVVLENSGWLRALARGLVGDDHTADDLVQDTWHAALRSPPPRSLRGWLATVLRHAASGRRRAEHRRRRREEIAATPEAVPDPTELVAEVEVQQRIMAIVRDLPEPYRSAILLRYFRGLSPTEIAVQSNEPAATVRSRIHRGLALIRERLDREHPGGRVTWVAVLLPFFRSRPTVPTKAAGTGAAVAGVLIMSTKAKLTLVVVLVLLFSGGVWWYGGSRGAGPGPNAPAPAPPAPAPDLAQLPDRPTAGSGQDPDTEAPSEDPPKGPPEVLAARDSISGRVMTEDGDAVPGAVVICGFVGGSFRVEHGSCFAVTDSDGRFSFPAVSGAPYAVYPLAGQAGFVGRRSGWDGKRTAGGSKDLLFVAKGAGLLVLRLVDEETGKAVRGLGCFAHWSSAEGRTRSSYVGTMSFRLGNREPAPGFAAPGDGLVAKRSESVFPIGLPPKSELETGMPVKIKVTPWDKSFEPAEVHVAYKDLDRNLGERLVRLRRLPKRGFTLRLMVKDAEGAPWSGTGRFRISRQGFAVQEGKFNVEAGEAQIERLSLGASKVQVWAENTAATLSPGPDSEGATAELTLTIPLRWTLVIDPEFEGEPTRLQIRWRQPGMGAMSIFTTGTWPYVRRGKRAQTAILAFFPDRGLNEAKLAEETIELVPGRKTVIRPRLPGKPPGAPSEATTSPMPAPGAAAPLEPGGPGVLVGRVIGRDGGVPQPLLVRLGRFADPGDPPDTPAWWETMTDAGGAFRFEGLPPGRYAVSAQPAKGTGARARFRVPPGRRIEPVELDLEPGGEIAVVVLGPAGEPLAGEDVGASPEMVGVTGRAGLHSARTDDQGRASFPDLRPGRYRVTWLVAKGQEVNREVDVVSRGTADVTFEARRTGTLSGRVLGPDGTPPGRAIVRLSGAGDAQFESEPDRDGNYRFPNVPPGEYRVGLQDLSSQPYTCNLGVVRIGPRDDRQVDYRVPDTRIEGRILRGDNGEALTRNQVQISASRTVDGHFEHAMCWLADDGGFTFVGLAPGAWNLSVIPRVAGLGMVQKEIELPASGRLVDLEVRLPAK